MKSYEKQLKNYPDLMNKDQFRRACHISPKTALFLLRTGLVPCHNNGKVTHCYSIKKADVIAYLKDKEKNPDKYLPSGYTAESNRLVPKQCTLSELSDIINDTNALNEYYSEILQYYPDLLDVNTITDITGYSKETVKRWISGGKLQALLVNRKYLVPKEVLLKWMSSIQFNSQKQKSMKHLNLLLEAAAKDKCRSGI